MTEICSVLLALRKKKGTLFLDQMAQQTIFIFHQLPNSKFFYDHLILHDFLAINSTSKKGQGFFFILLSRVL